MAALCMSSFSAESGGSSVRASAWDEGCRASIGVDGDAIVLGHALTSSDHRKSQPRQQHGSWGPATGLSLVAAGQRPGSNYADNLFAHQTVSGARRPQAPPRKGPIIGCFLADM